MIRENIVRGALLLIGLTIAHFGVTLFLLSDLGSDPFNVLIQGLFRTLQDSTGWAFLTHGRTHIAVSLIIIGALLIADRRYVKLGTLLCMICGGPIIDVFTLMLGGVLNAESAYAVRIISLAAGCAILAFGMTIVIKSDFGTGPNDLVSVVISDKTHTRFSVVRIVVDVAFLGVGYLLGGVFGLGTILCACIVGPVAGYFLPVSQKIVEATLKATIKKG